MKKLLSVITVIFLLFSLCSCETDLSGVPLEGSLTEHSGLTVHFMDVGQADCALLVCNGESMLIDGGNAGDSSFVYSYLNELGIDYLSCIIATHPHEDHVGGIPGALSCADVGRVYSPVTESDNYYFNIMLDKLKEKGVGITKAETGSSFDLGGAKVTFLGPVELVSDENDNSIMCKVEYGAVSFLFTGDAGISAENRVLDSGADVSATVLKVGHHGSASSTGYRFLREVDPVYGVISCELASQYGHPHEALLSRLRDAEVTVYRTDLNGTVIFDTDGETLKIVSEKSHTGSEAQSLEKQGGKSSSDFMYIGNTSSKKYHLPSCRSLPSEKNTVYFYSLEEALSNGFSPCGTCKP